MDRRNDQAGKRPGRLISKRRSNALLHAMYVRVHELATVGGGRRRWRAVHDHIPFARGGGAKNGEMFVRFTTSYRVNHACARYRCAITMRTNETYAIPSSLLFFQPFFSKPPPIQLTYEHTLLAEQRSSSIYCRESCRQSFY